MVFKSVPERCLPHLTHPIQLVNRFISRDAEGQKINKKSWEKIGSDLRQLLKK